MTCRYQPIGSPLREGTKEAVMAQDISWVPDGVDTSKPSVARICDYLVGGSHNLAVDRVAAQKLLEAEPNAAIIMRAQRAFLGRAVRVAASAGIKQFLDIGSGIPTQQNVHEVAQDAVQGARVVYVDIDPDTVAQANAILAGNPDAEMIHGDLRKPAQILAHPCVSRLIDFGQPAGLVIGSLLHFFPDSDEPWRWVAALGDALASGSYLIISQGSDQDKPEDRPEEVESVYRRASGTQAIMRTRAEMEPFFTGFELVEPGLVFAPLWRPDSAAPADSRAFWIIAGVGRKP
jgi:hypothetical protein